MIYKRFSIRLAVRLIALCLLLLLAIWLFVQPGYYAATVILASLFVVAAAELWWAVCRTNREIARFFDAARSADFSQRFAGEDLGSGFDELGQTFNDILDRMHEKSASKEVESRRLTNLIDHIPVPLITLHRDNSITLENNAVRRLFGAAHVSKLDDLKQFGEGFFDSVSLAVPGTRELVSFQVDGIEYQLTMAIAENVVGSESYRLISLQDIQSELDDTREQAWQDLVRVLTHEIMNSITPVTSLASTALDLVGDVQSKAGETSPIAEDLSDLRDAVTTVARRSDDLMQFVNSYRELDRIAPPEKRSILISQLFESIGQLSKAEWPDSTNWLSFSIEPAGLEVNADSVLLEPVLLNLLRNAWQATRDLDQPRVELAARLNRRGNVVIEVSDNGSGVAQDITGKIFVPFFTTKEEGSGVGLALARQVMTAHKGFIRVSESKDGGALFSLTF